MSQILIALIIILISIISMPVSADSTSPTDIDWIIKDRLIIDRQSLELDGDIIIESGGELHLRNVDLVIDCDKDGEHIILVKDGGELEVYNSKIKSDPSLSYVLIVEPKGSIFVYNSSISEFNTVEPDEEEDILPVNLFLLMILIIIMVSVLVGGLFFTLLIRTKQREKGLNFDNLKKLINKTGEVDTPVTSEQFKGKIKVGSESKYAIVKNTEKLDVGVKVKIVDLDNFNLVVEKLEK